MHVYVKNIVNGTVKTVIDKFISLIWTCRWSEAGEFEVVVPYETSLADQIEIGDVLILYSEGDLFAGFSPCHMMVETIEMGVDHSNNGLNLKLSGSSLLGFMDYRVNLNDTLYGAIHDTATLDSGEFAWQVYRDAFLVRSPMKLTIGESNLRSTLKGSDIAEDYYGSSCYDIFVSILRLSDAGHTAWYEDDDLHVHVYFSKPTDKTLQGNPNEPVLLSTDTESLESASYIESVANYYNCAIAYAIVEETDDDGNLVERYFHKATAKDGSPSGFFLKETSSSVSMSSSDLKTDESIQEVLVADSKKALSENDERIVQEAQVQQTKQYILGLDYTLGDIVTVVDDFGHVMDMLVSEISITADSGGIVVTPSFTKHDKD